MRAAAWILPALGALLFAAAVLGDGLQRLGDGGLWGPPRPWSHRDLLGGWWVWWAAAQPEGLSGWLARLRWPEGEGALAAAVPNPFDLLLLARAFGPPSPLAWNLHQFGIWSGNAVATAVLARALGAGPLAALGAAALWVGSPVSLFEVQGGRTLSGLVWPGLLAVAAAARGRAVLAGVLAAAQTLAYLYTGAAFWVAVLWLCPRPGLALGGGVVAAYAAWLAPAAAGLRGGAPPAGHTVSSLAGLVGLEPMLPRFRLHPGVAVAALLALVRGRRGLAAGAVGAALLALGPSWVPSIGAPGTPAPWAALWSLPGWDRMHHPLRMLFFAGPIALAAGAAALPRRGGRVLACAALAGAWAARGVVSDVPAFAALGLPPGAAASAALARLPGAGAALDLTDRGDAALGLQPLHRRPLVEGLRRPARGPRGGRAGAARAAADAFRDGGPAAPFVAALHAAGVGHVLVVERGAPPVDAARLAAALGPPVAPGVYAVPPSAPGSAPP